jgi:hypothetical protein
MIVNNKRKHLEEQLLKDSYGQITTHDLKGITMYEEPPQNIISLSDF